MPRRAWLLFAPSRAVKMRRLAAASTVTLARKTALPSATVHSVRLVAVHRRPRIGPAGAGKLELPQHWPEYWTPHIVVGLSSSPAAEESGRPTVTAAPALERRKATPLGAGACGTGWAALAPKATPSSSRERRRLGSDLNLARSAHERARPHARASMLSDRASPRLATEERRLLCCTICSHLEWTPWP